MIYCHSDKSFTTQEVLDILHHPEWTRVIREPPIKPRAGTAFLYHYEDEKKKDDWRCDQYHFQNDGIRKQPRSNPQFNKSFFVIRNAEGKKDGRFKKQAYKLLREHNNLVLIQYLGDESIAVDLPHGNSNDSSTVYTRVCPSTLANIKETSASPSEVLQQLAHQAQETKAPELHKPRSVLHIKNTRCRAKRKANPAGKKKRKRKKRKLTVCELNVALQVINNKIEDTSAEVCSSNLEKDSKVEESVPITPDAKSPNTRMAELAKLCENIYLENSGNQATYVPDLGDEDIEQGMSFVEERSLTELTTTAQNDIEHHQYTNSVQLQHLQVQDHQMTPKHQTDVSVEGNIENNSSDKGNNETVIQACSSLPHSLPHSLPSSNAINQDSNYIIQDGEISYIASYARKERIKTNNECNTNPRPQCLMTDMDASSCPVTHNLPMHGCHTATPSFENFLRDTITNGDLDQVLGFLRRILEGQGHTDSMCLSESTSASSTSAVLTLTDMLVDPNLSPITSSIQAVRSPHVSISDEITGHQTISSLISQVSMIWSAELDIARNIIIQSNVLEENKQSFLELLAALTVGAYKTCTNVNKFVETIKECPSHIELSRIVNNTTSIDVDGNYRIGKYTLYGKDIQQLDGDNWLDDSVIHAYLHLLQERYTEQGGQVLILECFLYTKWENLNHHEWLYKEVSLLENDWILLPICRSHHWVLLAANVRKRTVMVINSKPSPSAEADILNHWRKFMHQRSLSTGEVLTDWRTVGCPVFPQTDGSSCGVYVLMTAEAIIADIPAAILRNCHVTMYREYAKKRLLTAAKVSHCQPLERVRIDEDELMELQTDEKGEMMVELKEAFQESPDSSIIECKTLGREHPIENGIENDMKTRNGISDLLQKVLVVSSLHEEYDESIADLAFFQDMFENHKMNFAVVTFICLQNGSFDLTKTNPQVEDTMNTHARWSCILSGLDPRIHLQNLLCNIRDQMQDNCPIRFKQRDSIKVISSILSSNVSHFIDDIDLEFIHRHVVLQGRSNYEHDNVFLIRLSKAIHVNLATRFSEEIKKHNFAFTLTHGACSKHGFVVLLINSLKMCTETNAMEEMSMQSDRIFGGSFLNWTCFGKTAELYKLCSILMNLSKEEITVVCCISGNIDILHVVVEDMELHDLLSLRAKSKITGLNLNQVVEVFETHRLPLLHLACYYGHVPIIKCLLEVGFDVNAQLKNDFEESDQTPIGSTPVCLAAERGHTNAVRCLIEYGGDPNIVDCNYNSPLHLSCREGHGEAVGLLVNRCKVSERNMQGNTPLHLACVKCNHDIVCTLLRMQVDINILNFDDNTPLDIACINGSGNIVKLLMEDCPNYIPCDGSNTPLHKACNGGFTDIVNFLLRPGAENAVNINDKNPLTLALEKNYQHVVRILLEITNKKFVLPSSHLVIAIRNKQLSITQMLIEKGADVSAAGRYGYTPLSCACENGHIEIVKLLIEKGADVSAGGRYGYTPLSWACRNGHIEIVKLLIEKGADVSAADPNGHIPLSRACENGHIEIVKLLTKEGADLSTADSLGYNLNVTNVNKMFTPKGKDISNHEYKVQLKLLKGIVKIPYSLPQNLHLVLLRLAVNYGDAHTVMLLTENFKILPQVHEYFMDLLLDALKHRHLAIFRILYTLDDIKVAHNILLFEACTLGLVSICNDISERCSNIDGRCLIAALKVQNVVLVEMLMGKGVNLFSCDDEGNNSLHLACALGDSGIVDKLVTGSVSISGTNEWLETPLHVACKSGHLEIVQSLVYKDLDLTIGDVHGNTVLHVACNRNNTKIVQCILQYCDHLQRGIPTVGMPITTTFLQHLLSIRNQEKETPLHVACESGNLDIVQSLLSAGADVTHINEHGKTILHTACKNGKRLLFKCLLDHCQLLQSRKSALNMISLLNMVDTNGESALHIACRKNCIEIVKQLLTCGANIFLSDKNGKTPAAYLEKNCVLFQLFCKYVQTNSAVNQEGNSLLHISCQKGWTECVRTLLESGADTSIFNKHGDYPIHKAAENDNVEIIQLLLTCKSDINVFNNEIQTPLHIACAEGNTQVAGILIQHGAMINLKDKHALSPLHMACKEGNKDIAEIILKSNGEINHKDKNSNTPLYYACEEGRVGCASLLLQYGADVNLEGFRGNTPLHRACTQGHESIAILLLSCGADPARNNKSGHIPLYHAVLHNRHTIVKKLIDMSELDSSAYVQVLLSTACSRGNAEILETLFNQLNPALAPSAISLLHASIQAKHFNMVNILKNHGCDITERDGNGHSILHLLCSSEDTDIEHLEKALDMGLNIDDTSTLGETVLYLACLSGNDIIVPFIIEKGVSVLSKDKYGNTALHAACSNGQFEVAKLLIQKGSSLNELNAKGITPLDIAIKNQHYGVTCLYDQWYSQTRKYPRISLTSLWHICRQKKIGLLYNVEIVFSEQDSEGNSPLHIACLEEATDIVQLLIIAGAWLCVTNKSGDAPIHVACHKSYDVLKALLDTIVDKSVLLKMLSSNDKDGNSPLHIVTHELSISSLYLLLQKGANVNTANNFDQTALHIACYKGDPEIISALLSVQANILAQDKYGNTPLHIICMEGKLAVFKCIGHHQAFITLTNFEGRTPFHEAVKHEHYVIIRVMMLQYFKVSVDDDQEKYLRDFMHKSGTNNFVNLLIHEELQRQYSVETPLYQAAESGCLGIVELLLKRGTKAGTIHSNGRESPQSTSVESDIGSQTPLHISSLNGHKDIVELLLRYEQNVNQKTSEGKTPLHLACQAGHLSIVEVLLKAGSDINSTDNGHNTPLHVAAMFDRQDIIVHLAKWGVVDTHINENGDTALHTACANGHTESGKIILKLNNNVLKENSEKKTAVLLTCERGDALLAENMLHKLWINSKLEAVQEMSNPEDFGYKNHLDQCLYFACSQGHLSIIKLLLKYNADVNYILRTERGDNDGDNRQHHSPLYVACQKGHIDVVDLLIDSGATLDGRTNNDYTPLHIASSQGHSEIVSLLLKNGASASSVDAKQMAPLHLACQQGHKDVVEVLLVGGANPQTKDRDGKTPLDVCSDEGVRNILLASISTRHKRTADEYQHQGAPPQKKSRYR